MYSITLLRHGESEGNSAGVHQGHADFPLTGRGHEQARALAARWMAEQKHFDLAISSPLKRARQTAELLAEALKVPLEIDRLWMEYDIGRYSGLDPAVARQIYAQPEDLSPFYPMGETGESHWQVYLRAGEAVQSLLCRPERSYLVVSHGGLLNMVMYAILGITPHANGQGPRFPLANTAFITLSYEPAFNKWRVLGTNDRAHWKAGQD